MTAKIMSAGNLDNIVGRLTACIGLLHVIAPGLADAGDLSESLYAACDLLECITRDFKADIDGAEEVRA